jgi:NADH-quinone oxidoreductase subunit C
LTTAVTGSDLADAVQRRFSDLAVEASGSALLVAPDSIADVCRFLREDPQQDYDLLSSLTTVDYVEHFEIVYHLTSIARNTSVVLKARVYGREAPELPSVTGIWQGANLQEREAFDLMGVTFTGHPNLKRMLTWEGFQGHPLRRDYLEPPLPYTWPQGG